MYQISRKTGVRHVIEGDMPDNTEALKMYRGVSLPVAKCGRTLQPVNFYEPDAKSLPRYRCGHPIPVNR